MDLTSQQRMTILAAFLGWMLDAFDFFLLTFLLKDIAKEFGVEVPAVAYALFLTLAMRFVGAFIFGRLGDRWGRKPALMLDILCYSILGALAAFSPNLTIFLILRALFGVAMGGEWGLGSSLAMESIPPQARGLVSGILQCGYPTGYLLASIVFYLFYNETFFGITFGWRAMFLFSLLPAALVLFIRAHVPESPAFDEGRTKPKPGFIATLGANWRLSLYAIVLMMFFNLFSHGTQDLYPRFLEKQHGFDHHVVSLISIVANLGAITGGLFFGRLSEKIGRANAITIASLLALPATVILFSVAGWVVSARAILHGRQRPLDFLVVAGMASIALTLAVHIAFSYQRHLQTGWMMDAYPRYYLPLVAIIPMAALTFSSTIQSDRWRMVLVAFLIGAPIAFQVFGAPMG